MRKSRPCRKKEWVCAWEREIGPARGEASISHHVAAKRDLVAELNFGGKSLDGVSRRGATLPASLGALVLALTSH